MWLKEDQYYKEEEAYGQVWNFEGREIKWITIDTNIADVVDHRVEVFYLWNSKDLPAKIDKGEKFVIESLTL